MIRLRNALQGASPSAGDFRAIAKVFRLAQLESELVAAPEHQTLAVQCGKPAAYGDDSCRCANISQVIMRGGSLEDARVAGLADHQWLEVQHQQQRGGWKDENHYYEQEHTESWSGTPAVMGQIGFSLGDVGVILVGGIGS